MRSRLALLLVVASAVFAPAAAAQTRLAEIRARGHLACAAFPRAGLLGETAEGAGGLYADICRAIAIAALGPDAKFDFEALELPKHADDLGEDKFDVVFLTAPEIVAASLGGRVSPGPAVFFESYALMTEQSAAARTPEDLGGAPICFREASAAVLPLEERFDREGLTFIRMPFQEDVELLDAYNARHCKAIVAETTELAELRQQRGVNGFGSRIMAEPLAVFPVLATTPMTDSQWSAAVFWIVSFLQAAERPQTNWRPGGARSMAVKIGALGLEPSWRETILAKVGNYGAIYARNLGDGTPFKLPRGVNSPWAGGLFAPPATD